MFYAFFRYILILHSYDLVHIHTGPVPSLLRKYPFFKIARLLKKKIVLHLHIGTQIDDMAGNKLCQSFFDHSDAIIVLSEELKSKLNDLFGVPKNKIWTVYNPCVEVANVSYTDQNKIILYAGRLESNKGYDVLIRAFSRVAPEFPDWRIVFAGTGELSEAGALADKENISGQIEFRGWVSGEAKDGLFRQSSCLCLASYAEGFPMSILDAWAYSLPVVSTPVGGLREILKEGENALLFPPGDDEQLAGQLKRMMGDPVLRERIASNSYQLARTTFNPQHIGDQLDQLYQKILTA